MSPRRVRTAAFGVGAVAVTGDYAALVNASIDDHYGGSGNTVGVFDLRTATAVADRGGESAGFPDYAGPGYYSGVDKLVLGTDAVTAAHTFVISSCVSVSSCTTVEQIVANDSTGTHILDTITTTGPYHPRRSLAEPARAVRAHAHLEPRR